jgi:excisionase family DNA binding protein
VTEPLTAFEPLLDIHEVSAALNAAPSTVRKLVHDGHLTTVNVGRHLRFSPAAVRKFIETGGA